MMMWGKVIGGCFGLMLGGRIGAFFGIMVGHTFDTGMKHNSSRQPPPSQSRQWYTYTWRSSNAQSDREGTWHSPFGEAENPYQSTQFQKAASDLEEAYQLLDVSRTVTEGDLKQAYRKAMSEYHPDKLVSKGVPESVIRLATEKTQKIQAAYEKIKEAKGWH